MPTLQQNIAKKFLETLIESKNLDIAKIEQIRQLLENGKKPKADDFARIFSATVGGEVK